MNDPEKNRKKEGDNAASELSPPTRQEESDFKRLQMIVENGESGFIELGAALRKIYEHRLWRVEICESWEDYCRSIDGMSRSRAHRLMQASQFAVEMQAVSGLSAKPEFESQVRPLLALKNFEDRRAAWESAVRWAINRKSNGTPTALDVQRMVAERVSSLDGEAK